MQFFMIGSSIIIQFPIDFIGQLCPEKQICQVSFQFRVFRVGVPLTQAAECQTLSGLV